MSFYTALTGLNAATAQLGVTSNNIANVGTTGFKRSRADFGDIFATSPLQKAASVIGQGVALKSVTQEFSQGNIQFSASSLDIAITGDGFFPLKSADGLQDIYTRNGTFLLDDSFAVVNSAGQALKAATVDSSGKADLTNLKKLIIPRATTGDARETTGIDLGLNLPADGKVIAAPFDHKDPTTYNLTTAVTVFDSGGNDYLATVYYKKTGVASPDKPFNKWQTYVYIGDTKLDEKLIQSSDASGAMQYVNKYGEIRSEADIPAQDISRGVTKLFHLDDLANTQESVPAAVAGDPLNPALVTEWKNGIEIGNKLDNLGVIPAPQGIGFASSGLLDADFTPGKALVFNDGTRTFSVPEIYRSKQDTLDLLVRRINSAPVPYKASISSAGDLLIKSSLSGQALPGDTTKYTLTSGATPATSTYTVPSQTVGSITVSGNGVASPVTVNFKDAPTPGEAVTALVAKLNAEPSFSTNYLAVPNPSKNDYTLTSSSGTGTAAVTATYSVSGPALSASVTGVTSIASLVTALNSDGVFSKYYVASSSGDALSVVLRNPSLATLPNAAATLGLVVQQSLTPASTGVTTTSALTGVSQATGVKVFPKDPSVTTAAMNADLTFSTLATDSSVTPTSVAPTSTQLAAGTALSPLAADAQAAVGDISFNLNVDGAKAPIKVDLSYLNGSTDRYTGSEIAQEMTNAINKSFGDERYYDFSSLQVGNTAYIMRVAAVDSNQTPQDTDMVQINFTQGPTGDFPDLTRVTVDDAVLAIQRKLSAAAENFSDPQKTNLKNLVVSFDQSSQSFAFTSKTQKDVYVESGTDLPNDLLGLSVLPTKTDGATGLYGQSTPPNGALLRDAADQRYGIKVTFDDTARVFRISSGQTGDTSSIKVSGASDLANALFGFSKSAAGVQVLNSTTPLRGISSQPAVLSGSPIGVNINNKFRVDASNNQFVVTVDNVTGLVTIPPKADYTAGEFTSELERRINSLADSFGRTVSGVMVDVKQNAQGQSYFEITTGTTGNDAFLKVTASSIWGLADAQSARGSTSKWLTPPQARNADGFPLYVDRDGNETTDPGNFSETESLDKWSPIYLDKGELTFDTAGNLKSPKTAIGFQATTIGQTGATLQFSINYDGSTQFSSPFAVQSQNQNGRPEGDLIGLDIGDNGLVSANYSNGTQKNLAKVVLANFSAPTGLRQIGNASYYATSQSGTVTLGEAGTAGFGTVKAGARERANVDLTQELIELITAQRNFQANAKAIETNNTLTQAIINIRS